MAKKMIQVVSLILIFAITLLLTIMVVNRGEAHRLIKMERASLPRISFQVAGETVNPLIGYVDEMDITAMRDSITPLAGSGSLAMQIEPFENVIELVEYQVFSLNGEHLIVSEEIKTNGYNHVVLPLTGVFEQAQGLLTARELVLQVTLHTDDRAVHFYTRIVASEDLAIASNLNFVQNFHRMTFDPSEGRRLEQHLLVGPESDNNTLQQVTQFSSIDNVLWGGFSPQIQGDVQWNIMESNIVFTSILASYRVQIVDGEGLSRSFNVREFFRVRTQNQEVVLLDYYRQMNQIFELHGNSLRDNHLILGTAPGAIEYLANEEEDIIAFVQEGELWIFNQAEHQMIRAFSFTAESGNDLRNQVNQHAIHVLNVDESGSTAFVVFGYMSRGSQEGRVGAQVFFYDAQRNVLEERAFIPSNLPYAIAYDLYSQMLYYNHDNEALYIMVAGTFYRVDLSNHNYHVIVEQLAAGQYASGEGGELLAWQESGSLYTATTIQVRNLRTGVGFSVEAPAGQSVRPLGFIHNDFIAGFTQLDLTGTSVLGETIRPMSALAIFDEEGDELKRYQQDFIFIADISVHNNLITMNRLVQNGAMFSGTSQDFISSIQEVRPGFVSVESFHGGAWLRQMRLELPRQNSEGYPIILRPRKLPQEQPLTVAFDENILGERYFVYARGELVGIFDRAAYAVAVADEQFGVVISAEQTYVWERGNRFLVYDTEFESFITPEGQTSRMAALGRMHQEDGQEIDFTGATVTQMLYVINRGLPVVAILNQNDAILLVAYNHNMITFMDPNDGLRRTVSIDYLDGMMTEAGNTFIGFVPK